MLAPLIIELLIASLLLLLAGWISDILHASTHERPNYLNSTGAIGWDQISRPRKPLPSTTTPARRGGLDRAAASATRTNAVARSLDQATRVLSPVHGGFNFAAHDNS